MVQPSIKRIGIVVKPHQPDALQTLCRLTEWLSQREIKLVGGPEIERERIEHETGCVVESLKEDALAKAVDLMLVLGGDGTMIATARMLGDIEVPVMGVNYGGLGYLAEFPLQELFSALEAILAGDYKVQERLMLAVELRRGEELITKNRVLNDVVVNKSALARIIEIEVRLMTENEEVALTLDGQVGFPLQAGDRAVIRKSNATFNLVQPANRNYFDVLRDKLKWGR